MKVGLIRCLQTEDMCPATTDLKVMREKKCAFEGVEGEIEVIGINTCGGCPGKKAVSRAAETPLSSRRRECPSGSGERECLPGFEKAISRWWNARRVFPNTPRRAFCTSECRACDDAG